MSSGLIVSKVADLRLESPSSSSKRTIQLTLEAITQYSDSEEECEIVSSFLDFQATLELPNNKM